MCRRRRATMSGVQHDGRPHAALPHGPAGKPSQRGMTSRVQPGHGWTVVLWRRPTRIVAAGPKAGIPRRLSLPVTTAVTIPTWITARSHPSFGRSAVLAHFHWVQLV